MPKGSNHYTALKERKIIWDRICVKGLDIIFYRLMKEEDHSFGMIFDLIQSQHSEVYEGFVATKGKLQDLLKAKGFLFDSQKYLRKTQQWKLQYRYTPEQVKEQCRKGQKATIDLRNEREFFTKVYSLKYWIDKGLDKETAQKELTLYKQRRSPWSVEFYISRGKSEQEAKEIVRSRASFAAVAGLKKSHKSNCEKVVKLFLEKNKILFSEQFPLKVQQDIKLSLGKRRVVFDFWLPEFNSLLEVNGSYWHCDPRFYLPKEEVTFPGKIILSAEDIWKRDFLKKKVGESHGFNSLVVWEHDIIHNTFQEKLKNELQQIGRVC